MISSYKRLILILTIYKQIRERERERENFGKIIYFQTHIIYQPNHVKHFKLRRIHMLHMLQRDKKMRKHHIRKIA